MTNLQDDGSSASAQIYVASITGVSCPNAAQKPLRSRSAHKICGNITGIVVTKPPNKAGRPVAEPVEPRPGTKGNADQQSTHRAQSRARVTQALGRVRQAARQRKKEQFPALLHHISIDTLR